MEMFKSGFLTLGIFVIITLFVFIAWVIGLIVVWGVFTLLGLSINLMSTIEALSTALAVASVFGAGYFAFRELSEASKTRYMEIADKLFNELNSPENIEARRTVYALNGEPENELSKDDRRAIKKVLNSLDRVAFLTQKGWIPDEIIMPWMHPMIAKSWEKLEPYVIHQRNQRSEPYYYEHASELAKRCDDWCKNHLPELDVKYIDHAI